MLDVQANVGKIGGGAMGGEKKMSERRKERNRIRKMLKGLRISAVRAKNTAPQPFQPPSAWPRRKEKRLVLLDKVLAVLLLVMTAFLLVFAISDTARGESINTYTVSLEDGVLNIRENPWVGAEIIGCLYNGDAVSVISDKDGWALVEAPIESGQGYVCNTYLTLNADDCGKYVNVSGGRVRVRQEPGGKLVRWLKAGDTVVVTRWTEYGGCLWAYVRDGYVLGDCIVKVEEENGHDEE